MSNKESFLHLFSLFLFVYVCGTACANVRESFTIPIDFDIPTLRQLVIGLHSIGFVEAYKGPALRIRPFECHLWQITVPGSLMLGFRRHRSLAISISSDLLLASNIPIASI